MLQLLLSLFLSFKLLTMSAGGLLAHFPRAPLSANSTQVGLRSYLPGRGEDDRVERIAWRLAVAGRAHCPNLAPATGLVLQHLTQFELRDRAAIITALPLNRGPGVITVAPGSPAAFAGIVPGDVLLSINGKPLSSEPGITDTFSAAVARARADDVADLLEEAHSVTLLHNGITRTVSIVPVRVCPSRVLLARSMQHNAFADGRHVFLTTGVLSLLRNNDELAFLIAHEMAHNILGHATLMRSGTLHGRDIRKVETDADLLGGQLMLDAGLDPVIGATLLERVGGADFGIALFADHEPVRTRIAALRALVQAHRLQ